MPNVWYVGPHLERRISASDWLASGAPGTSVKWGPENGYAIDQATLSSGQLAVLANDQEFLLGQSGLRPTPPNPANQELNDFNYLTAARAYYAGTKKIVDDFNAGGGVGYAKPARGIASKDIALERKPFGELSLYAKPDSDFAHIPTVDDVGNAISWTYGGDTPIVKNGAFTLQGKSTGGPVNAAYLIADAGVNKKISRIGCDFAFDSTGKSTAGESICIAIMNQSSVNLGNTAFRIGVHFYITETGWMLQKVSCATGSAVFTTIASGTFSESLLTDGTEYRAEVNLTDAKLRLVSPTGVVETVIDYEMSQWAGRYGFVECYQTTQSTDNLPRIMRMWYDNRLSVTKPSFVRDRGGNGKAGIYVPTDWGTNWRNKIAAAKAGTGLAKIAVRGDSISFGAYCSDLDAKSYPGLLKTSLQTLYGNGGSGFKGAARVPAFLTGVNAIPSQAQSAWSAAGNLFTQGGTWGAFGTGQGPGVARVASTTNAAGETMTGTFYGTKLEIYTRTTGGTESVFTYAIDGGAPVTVNPPGTTGVLVTTVTGLSAGAHTVVITKAASAATLAFFGIRGLNSSGVVLDNYGFAGASSDTFNPIATDPTSPGRWSGGGAATSSAADLLIYALGPNDCNSNYKTTTGITISSNAAAGATTLSLSAYVPPGRYIVDSEFVHVLSCNGTTATLRLPAAAAHNTGATLYIQTTTPELARWNLEAAINDLQSYGNGTSDVLVLIPHAGLQANCGNYANLVKELRGACEAYGAAMVDIWTLGRSNYNYWNLQGFFGGGTNATAGTAGTDTVHPSDAGHKFMHDQILPLLVA